MNILLTYPDFPKARLLVGKVKYGVPGCDQPKGLALIESLQAIKHKNYMKSTLKILTRFYINRR